MKAKDRFSLLAGEARTHGKRYSIWLKRSNPP